MAKRDIVAVFLVTQDVEGIVAFYRDRLGLEVARHEPGHSAWFNTGGVPLVVHRPEAEERPGIDYTPETPVLVWLRPADGVEQAVVTADRAGLELCRPRWASNYAYVRDPEGRWVGFHEPNAEVSEGPERLGADLESG